MCIRDSTYIGVVAIFASAFFPWMRVSFGDSNWKLGPLWTEEFRPSTILLLGLLVLLGALAAKGTLPLAAIALPAQVWGMFAVSFWLAGLGLQSLLPRSIVPDSVIPKSSFTILLAVIGTMMVSITVLAESLGMLGNLMVRVYDLAFGIVVIMSVLIARDLPWVVVDVGVLKWRVGADVVPVLGGLVSLVALAVAAIVLTEMILETSWSQIVLIVLGIFLSLFGSLALMLRSVFRSLANYGIEHAGVPSAGADTLGYGIGPWVLIAAGLVTVGFAVLRNRASRTLT